jgi:hypothetical protein
MRRELKGRLGRGIGPLKDKDCPCGAHQQAHPRHCRQATGKTAYVKALADEVQRGGIAAWKALRDLLPRDDDIPSASPPVSFSQLFIGAHKEINRLEQTKTVPPVIDVTAEPILAVEKLTDMRDGAGGGQPAANASDVATSWPSAPEQSGTEDANHVEW